MTAPPLVPRPSDELQLGRFALVNGELTETLRTAMDGFGLEVTGYVEHN